MMEIGINNGIGVGSNVLEELKLIKESGFKNVMIRSKCGNLEGMLQAAQSLGLKVPSVHLSSVNADDLWNKGETNDRYMQTIMNEIAICGKYNIPVVIMHATCGNPTNMLISLNEYGIECMEKIVEYAKTFKIKVALENLDNSNIKRWSILLDSIKSKNFGVCYDIGHHQLYNSQVDIAKKYVNRIFAVHIHDNMLDYEYGCDWTRDLHLLPFDGKIDFARMCRKLRLFGYKGVLMLEVLKNGPAEPRPYLNMTDKEFLNEARTRIEKIASVVSK